jgi:hypothetical protein
MANDNRAEESSTHDENPRYEPPRIMRKRAVVEVTMVNCSNGKKSHNPLCGHGRH